MLRYEATKSEARFLTQHALDEQGRNEQASVSTPTSFLNRACWNDLFSSGLDTASEVPTVDEEDGGDEDSEQRFDGDGGGENLSETGAQPNSQRGASGGYQLTSRQGRRDKSGGSRGNASHQAQLSHASLEYMDEEERVEAVLRREIQTSFHKMLYVPEFEDQGTKGALPSEISLV